MRGMYPESGLRDFVFQCRSKSVARTAMCALGGGRRAM